MWIIGSLRCVYVRVGGAEFGSVVRIIIYRFYTFLSVIASYSTGLVHKFHIVGSYLGVVVTIELINAVSNQMG